MTVFYIYKLDKDNKSYIGFGISDDFERRHKQHLKTFAKNSIVWELIYTKTCKTRKSAELLESKVKEASRGFGLNIPGFKTESIPAEHKDKLLEAIRGFDFEEALPENPINDYQILYRFSKTTGIPTDELDVSLVKMLTGRSGGYKSNLKLIYQSLQKFHVLVNDCKKANITFGRLRKILACFASGELPEGFKEWADKL